MVTHFKSHCPYCHERLVNPNDQAMGVCRKLECRGPHLRKQQMEDEMQRRVCRENFATKTLANLNMSVDKADGVDGESLPANASVIVVPALEAEVTTLPDDRRRMFEEHLENVLQAAATSSLSAAKQQSLLTEFEHRNDTEIAPSPPIVQNACSTCRGVCCQQGGTTAFLTADFLKWQMLVDEQTVDSLRQQYLERLPEESVANSCVYHTPNGCQLPRNIRSEICNCFHCEGLMDAFAFFDQQPPVYSIAIAAVGEESRRIGILAPGEIRRELSLEEIQESILGGAASFRSKE